MQFPSMEIGRVYFFTATILNWKNLLKPDKFKDYIIESLQFLIRNKKIVLYGYVIMPNHVHFIWKMVESNGKEMPNASLMKYTGHRFLEELRNYHPTILPYFEAASTTRFHHFWQRNSLPFEITREEAFIQKLNYIHLNPLQPKWNLCEIPEEYRYSSANFYSFGIDEFDIVTHWKDRN